MILIIIMVSGFIGNIFIYEQFIQSQVNTDPKNIESTENAVMNWFEYVIAMRSGTIVN